MKIKIELLTTVLLNYLSAKDSTVGYSMCGLFATSERAPDPNAEPSRINICIQQIIVTV